MKAVKKGFVFGKFLPFHKGHEALIKFAVSKCDLLTVLVCCSDKENIPCEIRKEWIESTFYSVANIEVKCFTYLEKDFPNTSEPSLEVSKIWAEIFKTIVPAHKVLITSEEYGDYVASNMNIEHIPYDLPRQAFPVSATAIRKDLFNNWKFLPDSVKPFYAIKIIILGTESSGKTTLTQQLAHHFKGTAVMEAGRDLIPDSKTFEFEDLYLVAAEHKKRIDKAVVGSSPLIIIDTDIHITKSYGRFIFQKELTVNDEIYKSNKADLYLYLNNDVDYIQDGTRLDVNHRNLLDGSHRQILKDHSIDIIEIKGTWDQRFTQAKSEIENLLKNKANMNKMKNYATSRGSGLNFENNLV